MRLIAGVLLGALFWGCAGSDSVRVDLDEYTLEVSPAEAPTKPVYFEVHNVGQIEHELIVLRTNRDPDDLPVGDAEVQTNRPGVRLIKKTPRIKTGDSTTFTIPLLSGTYVLLCNIPGHYQSGMRTAFRVP